MSYASFLADLWTVDPQVVAALQAYPQPLYGLGIDAVSAQDAWGLGLPGFDGLKLAPGPGPGMGRDAIPNEEAEKYFFHFPDGKLRLRVCWCGARFRMLFPAATRKTLLPSRCNMTGWIGPGIRCASG